jgi:hypothetical protein
MKNGFVNILFFFSIATAWSQQLIQNGNFSSPNAYWVTGGTGFYWGNNPANCYRSPTAYAWFSDANGSYQHHNNVSGWIYQEFTVPQNIANAVLQFYTSINTYDSDAFPYDSLIVQLWNQNNLPVATIMVLSNENGSPSLLCQPYVLRQETNKISTALALRGGQTLRLAFKAINDATNGTIFRIDDVSLTYTLNCVLPDAPSLPQGPVSVCIGESHFYSINPLAGNNNYTWTVTNGTIIAHNNTSIEVLWDSAGTGTVQVYATNACGNGPPSPILQVAISTIPNLTISASSYSLCSGQSSVTLTASGASAYLWSNGAMTSQITVLTGGWYALTGTNGSCSATEFLFLTENPPPSVTISANPGSPVMPNTPVQLSVTPGNAPFYTWSVGSLTGSNPLVQPDVTTTYHVTVTDANGCSATGYITIVVTQPPQCDNSYATLSHHFQHFSGDGGVDSFSVNFTPSATGCIWSIDQNDCSWVDILQPLGGQQQNRTVVFQVSSNTGGPRSCTLKVYAGNNVYDFNITQDSMPDNCSGLLPPTIFDNGNCELEAEYLQGVTYQWYVYSNMLPGATSRFHTATQTGDYYVVVTDSNNCSVRSSGLFMDCLTLAMSGLPEHNNAELLLYPNPNKGSFQLAIKTPDESFVTIKIFNPAGQLVFEQNCFISPHNYHISLQLSTLAKGVYSAVIISQEFLPVTKRFLVEE